MHGGFLPKQKWLEHLSVQQWPRPLTTKPNHSLVSLLLCPLCLHCPISSGILDHEGHSTQRIYSDEIVEIWMQREWTASVTVTECNCFKVTPDLDWLFPIIFGNAMYKTAVFSSYSSTQAYFKNKSAFFCHSAVIIWVSEHLSIKKKVFLLQNCWSFQITEM